MPASEELFYEYELLRQDIAAIDSQIRELEEHHNSLIIARETIKALKGFNGGELIVPAGAGVYLNGALSSDSSFLINVGANILIDMSIDKADKVLSERVDQALSMIVKLNEDAELMIKRINEINSLLQAQ